MRRIDTGTIQIHTYKDGLLSAVAHDLRLTLQRFELDLEVGPDGVDGTVDARFFVASLGVDGAMKGGALDPRGLSESQKLEIQGNVQGPAILKAARFPEVRFQGRPHAQAPSPVRVEGTLSLAGRDAPLSVTVRREGGRLRGEVEFAPSTWGIAPFKALLGAIKLKDRVRVTFDLPDA